MTKEFAHQLPPLKSMALAMIVFPVLIFLTMKGMAQDTRHGFRLIEKRFVSEVNAQCLYFEHVKSGARLLKIESDDDNKTFGITFKTVPSSDNGVAHITEHSVLNGSKNFPAKSPFDILSKGSLRTFVNAMTGRDATYYPIASMNEKDYFNLMHVYLDAVLFPLLYNDERILQQEGWHHELTDDESPVVYKGVVYNEMKGAFSNPQRELRYQMLRNIFPDNVYGRESGGTPAAIPTLTQKDFVAFHQKFYHPENSYIFLYGNAPLDKELDFIDKNYLSHFTKGGNRATIEDQKPFAARKDVLSYYNVMEGNDQNQTFLTLSYVIGHNTDQAQVMALEMIADVLVNQESAPVRIALQKAGIGKDVYAGVTDFKQNLFSITVLNANADDKDKFVEIVTHELTQQASVGLDKNEIAGVLSRMEFSLREGNSAQKGIGYMNQIRNNWFFDNDPFAGLEYEKTLKTLKNNLKTNYLEKMIQDGMLNNPHSLVLTMAPKAGLDAEKNAATAKELADYKASLTPEARQKLIADTRALIEYQNEPESPEAVASIPTIALSDINPKAAFYTCEEKKAGATRVLFRDEFTNGIVYSRLLFDMRVLPEDLLPYASLLSDLLGTLNTKNYTYGKLNNALNVNTGGFYTSIQTFSPDFDDNRLIPMFAITSKALSQKVSAMFDLTGEIVLQSLLSDTERIHELLVRRQSQLQSTMNQDGFNVASSRLPAYFSREGVFNQLTSGLDYYWFLSNLAGNFNAQSGQIATKLQQVADLLFTRQNLMANITCPIAEYQGYADALTALTSKLPSREMKIQSWNLTPEMKNEGIMAASKVQYVIAGYNMKKLGYSWNGNMRVLSQMISSEWLHNQIRVIGGAYGGYSRFGADGMVTFNSYRDPNLKKTIETYKATADFLRKAEIDQAQFDRFIIGTIANLDMPLTASQRGNRAFDMHLNNRKQTDIQAERDAILKATIPQMKAYASMVEKIMEQGAVCVFGNTQKINQEKECVKTLIKVDQQ